MNIDQVLNNSVLFEKLAQAVIENIPTAQVVGFFQNFLFNNNLFYGPMNGNVNDKFAELWMSLLNASGIGDAAYNVDITIPAGTLSVVFSGTPGKLISYLNKNLAPRIAKLLIASKGKKVEEYTIQEPKENLTFKYMYVE